MSQQPSLSSDRLFLRPYRLEDAREVQRLAGDARVADTTAGIPHPYPDGAAETWISAHAANFDARKEIDFAVTLQGSGRLVGTVTLLDIAPDDARAELGYMIGVDYWSHGYATEAVCRLIQFAFGELALSRIVGRCLARNKASARVMEKAGLRQEGYLVRHVLKNAKFEDVLLYGLNLSGRTP